MKRIVIGFIATVFLGLFQTPSQIFAAPPGCQILGYYCTDSGLEMANYDETCSVDELTGRNCTYEPNNQCHSGTTCTGGSVCDCQQVCVLPGVLGAGKECCSDRGNVCQSGLFCVSNKCGIATATPTSSSSISDATSSADEAPVVENPASTDKQYSPIDFSDLIITIGFVILAFVVIFSVIH